MSTQMLFYDNIEMVTREQHGNLSLKRIGNFEFTKNVNSVPLMVPEFINSANEFPIVFAGNDQQVLPHAVVGTRDQENLFLDEEGQWQGKYVPAFIRRYPFVFSSADDGQTLTLCIDRDCPGFNEDGNGERLFDTEGEQTMYLKNVVEFLRSYQRFFQATISFCEKLKSLDLLTGMQANITSAGGETNRMTGFFGVDRQKLRDLDDEVVLEMHKSGELDLIHAHLLSMENFRLIVDRVKSQEPEDQPEVAEPVAVAAGSSQEDATPVKKKATRKKKAK